MLGRRITLGQQLAADIGAAVNRPGEVCAVEVDVTQPDSVQAAAAQAVALQGAPRILVNNAGGVVRTPSLAVIDADWQAVVDVNLSGLFRMAQAAAREMVAAGQGGSIVNIASILGLRVRPAVASYAATKAAAVHLTQALALEWAEHGIRVNALAPGYFETDLNREMLRSDTGRALIARIPQQRVGQLAWLDGPLLLLASDAGAYMTGVTLPVDGGHLVNSL